MNWLCLFEVYVLAQINFLSEAVAGVAEEIQQIKK